VAPSRRTGSRAVRLAPAVADWLATRTYSVPDQRCHTRPPTRSGRTALKRKRPGGDRRYTAECPPSEEGTRPRTHVGIPGPDVCGTDADTPTSTALAPCGVRASRLVSVGTNSNGSPTATDVAVSLASWRHEDATCGPRCSVAAARAEPVQRRTLAGTLPWPGCAPLPVCSHPEVGAPGGERQVSVSVQGTDLEGRAFLASVATRVANASRRYFALAGDVPRASPRGAARTLRMKLARSLTWLHRRTRLSAGLQPLVASARSRGAKRPSRRHSRRVVKYPLEWVFWYFP
jgi:hypothetical protein